MCTISAQDIIINAHNVTLLEGVILATSYTEGEGTGRSGFQFGGGGSYGGLNTAILLETAFMIVRKLGYVLKYH